MLSRVKLKHVREITIYGIVGLAAWVLQSLLYMGLLNLRIFPSIAMVVATLIAFLFAYTGHVLFTFKVRRFIIKQFLRSVSNSLITLIINVILVRLTTKVFLLSPHYAVFPTLLTPGISFVISKFWVFR